MGRNKLDWHEEPVVSSDSQDMEADASSALKETQNTHADIMFDSRNAQRPSVRKPCIVSHCYPSERRCVLAPHLIRRLSALQFHSVCGSSLVREALHNLQHRRGGLEDVRGGQLMWTMCCSLGRYRRC
ncbi:hypothetical protein KC19_6G189000 [Ceratodon purpureus]|uniref:Uncharacterized protein n=1 Tax=Ceratodon purpureus TaxID=3225 RepID=A0A8T0HJ45_CERPU|nr:hypothetical protein KC19_6G189000 [Ceratodon purpureus]